MVRPSLSLSRLDLALSSLTRSLPRCAQVGVNTGLISQAGVPFGGVKESGFGREGASSLHPLLPRLARSSSLTVPSLRSLSLAGSKYGLQDWQQIKLVALGGL